MGLIRTTKTSNGYNIYYENNKLLGQLEPLEDGYYYYWPNEDLQGCWDSHTLRAIADKLNELNEPWDRQINDYFEKENMENEGGQG